ncbi:transmembrane protein, putative, partial [Bodo saltans]
MIQPERLFFPTIPSPLSRPPPLSPLSFVNASASSQQHPSFFSRFFCRFPKKKEKRLDFPPESLVLHDVCGYVCLFPFLLFTLPSSCLCAVRWFFFFSSLGWASLSYAKLDILFLFFFLVLKNNNVKQRTQ